MYPGKAWDVRCQYEVARRCGKDQRSGSEGDCAPNGSRTASPDQQDRLELLGYGMAGEELNSFYENFLLVADVKKLVDDNDLMMLMANHLVLVK